MTKLSTFLQAFGYAVLFMSFTLAVIFAAIADKKQKKTEKNRSTKAPRKDKTI